MNLAQIPPGVRGDDTDTAAAVEDRTPNTADYLDCGEPPSDWHRTPEPEDWNEG